MNKEKTMKKLIACLALGYNPKGEKAMRKSLVARISTLLAGVLFCLGSGAPAQAGNFHVTLNKATPQVKVNVLSGAGNWMFFVTVKGKVSVLGRQIKDNDIGAGDICWVSVIRQPKATPPMYPFSDTAFDIPAATEDACGTDWPDTNGPKLTLFAYIQTADPKASVDIDVFYPDPIVALNHSATGTASQRIVPIASQEVWAIKRSLRL